MVSWLPSRAMSCGAIWFTLGPVPRIQHGCPWWTLWSRSSSWWSLRRKGTHSLFLGQRNNFRFHTAYFAFFHATVKIVNNWRIIAQCRSLPYLSFSVGIDCNRHITSWSQVKAAGNTICDFVGQKPILTPDFLLRLSTSHWDALLKNLLNAASTRRRQ